MKDEHKKFSWIIGDVTLGENVWVGAFTLLDGKHAKLVIGEGSNISSGAQVLTHSTVRRCISEGKVTQIDFADVTIGKYCFVGTNAVILMGCKIGHHSVIGAGAVISQNTVVPPYSIVTGVPARIVGDAHKYTT